MKKGRGGRKNTQEHSYWVKSSTAACLLGMAVTAVMLFLFGAALATWDLPLAIIGPMSVLAVLGGCFFSGFLSAKLMNQHGMMWGALCGSVLFVCLLSAYLVSGQPCFPLPLLTKGAMMITTGMIGGIFGVNFGR